MKNSCIKNIIKNIKERSKKKRVIDDQKIAELKMKNMDELNKYDNTYLTKHKYANKDGSHIAYAPKTLIFLIILPIILYLIMAISLSHQSKVHKNGQYKV